MSTGFECEFFRTADDQWFYALQDWDCPVGAWDWHEYASSYGPFATEDEALAHLDDNHANPGGYFTDHNSENAQPSEVWAKLIKAARPAREAEVFTPRFRRW
jgi:hypothetical protein